MPRNAATLHRYRGINVLTLGMSNPAFSIADPRWATYMQAEDQGWQVRKGERGTTGYFFFKRLELRDDTRPNDDEDAVAIMFVVLIPYSAFRDIGRALGPGELRKLLFSRPVPLATPRR